MSIRYYTPGTTALSFVYRLQSATGYWVVAATGAAEAYTSGHLASYNHTVTEPGMPGQYLATISDDLASGTYREFWYDTSNNLWASAVALWDGSNWVNDSEAITANSVVSLAIDSALTENLDTKVSTVKTSADTAASNSTTAASSASSAKTAADAAKASADAALLATQDITTSRLGDMSVSIADVLEKPDTGQTTVPITVLCRDNTGAAVDLDDDNDPIIYLRNSVGTSLNTARLTGWVHTVTGKYTNTYINTSTDAVETLSWEVIGIITGKQITQTGLIQLLETTTPTFTEEDRALLEVAATQDVPAAGTIMVEVPCTVGGQPVQGVAVCIMADATETAEVIQGVVSSDINGIATFYLPPGSYYVRRVLRGYQFTNPYLVTVPAP